jgi:flagellar hook-associated protein 3 FlgL
MVGITAPYGGYGLPRAAANALSELSAQSQSLTAEAATGVTSDSYAGLGSGRTQALSLDPAITQIASWQGNVTTAQDTLSVTQTAVSGIASLATSLSASLATLGGTPDAATVQAAITSARNALQSLGGLLDTQSGANYVFAGRDSGTAPVGSTDLADSGLATSIASVVSQDGNTNATAVLSDTLSLAANTQPGSPFSVALSTTPQQAASLATVASVGPNDFVSIGMTATQGTTASSSSTGSPVRDLMRNLMVVASLGQVSTGSASYDAIVQGLRQSTSAASAQLSTMAGLMGVAQDTLDQRSASLSQMSVSLTTQLANVKDADLASVSTLLTQTQNQLQASYSIIANMKGMTLAAYI